MKILTLVVLLSACDPSPSRSPNSAPGLEPIHLTCVDQEAIGYATFQSHNQKVVANRFGIFMSYLRTRNEPYTAQMWRLMRSVDGGKTFAVIHEAIAPTNPPVLETDSQGNIYVIQPDFSAGCAYLYRYLAEKKFKVAIINVIPNGAAGKYAACIDEQNRRLYYFAHNNTFHVLDLEGKLLQSYELMKNGPDAVLQYPQLFVERNGRVHAAWTTQKNGVYLYWDIHHMVMDYAGAPWRNLNGTLIPTPAVADQHGPAMRITLDDEFDVHTWLSSFTVNRDKVHFLYEAQTNPPREHYMRYDLAGRREVDTQPMLKGQTISLLGLDGFFAIRPDGNGPIYCIGAQGGNLACLVSRDNGTSWHDYARTEKKFNLYSIGGCRFITKEGWIIGSFTDQHGSNLATDRSSKVYFFKIRAR